MPEPWDILATRAGFPRAAVLRGALTKSRGDLLSLTGVIVLAAAFALTNAVFPDDSAASLGHRSAYGVGIVLLTMIVVALADFLVRLTTYHRSARSAWTVSWIAGRQFVSFTVRARADPWRGPSNAVFVVRTPDNRFLELRPDPADDVATSLGQGGTTAVMLDPQESSGRFEVRVYEAVFMTEYIRTLVDIARTT